jgi:hypothetical protein
MRVKEPSTGHGSHGGGYIAVASMTSPRHRAPIGSWVSMQRPFEWLVGLSAMVIAGALCVLVYQGSRGHGEPALSTPYHAVALTNGQVFFGRVEALGGDYTVLRDVFYIQSRQNPDTKQVANVLIKRGGEWHAPDRMIINRQQVLLIEPVKEDSQVARLIAEQNKTAVAK